ncbi:MAG: biopolymer transporter ExbD [Chitinivibrionales bacterium]|nr:biopolymer transporter ExbD [Chitinivibrionales bacterium]
MALLKKKSKPMDNLNLVPMIDITSFILLALAILAMSMKKEASLDNIVKLPPILHANKQDKTLLQIYILPAKILAGGYIDPDSTGLVAFTGKGKPPLTCPNCALSFRDKQGVYIPGALLDLSKKPVQSLQQEKEKEVASGGMMMPPAYLCSRCGYEISPYLKLDDIPKVIGAKKKEVLAEMVRTENFSREKAGKPLLTKQETDAIEKEIPLMIKADEKAFYGRILQVVNMAKDTASDIRKFAFISLPEAAEEVVERAAAIEKQKQK